MLFKYHDGESLYHTLCSSAVPRICAQLTVSLQALPDITNPQTSPVSYGEANLCFVPFHFSWKSHIGYIFTHVDSSVYSPKGQTCYRHKDNAGWYPKSGCTNMAETHTDAHGKVNNIYEKTNTTRSPERKLWLRSKFLDVVVHSLKGACSAGTYPHRGFLRRCTHTHTPTCICMDSPERGAVRLRLAC